MFRSWLVLPVLVVAWALLPNVTSGQSGTAGSTSAGVTIIGSVVDGTLAPLSGVAVTLERNGRPEARTTTAADGTFRFTNVGAGTYRLRAERPGYPALTRDLRVTASMTVIRVPIVLAGTEGRLGAAEAASDLTPPPAAAPAPPERVAGAARPPARSEGGAGGRGGGNVATESLVQAWPERSYRDAPDASWSGYPYPRSGERYAHVEPNRFQSTAAQPLSTFGADVDTASYTNVRRYLSSGQLPPRDAVRIEEFVNYFRFAYDEPRGNRPLALTTEVADCPWAPSHKLVLIGARARASVAREIEGRNIVLLIDVSGSMGPPERLPLIQTALGLFVDTLQPDDRLALVTYAGSSGVALPSTPVRHRDIVQRAIAGLRAGGSTNGGQGLIMAYRTAREAFIPGGVNRVILATDGDFNVGITSRQDLLHLIERERESGVFLSVFGVGSGNLKDATMEMLADRGNGHYAYLDSLQEARRVLVREADATLETVAKDVKFQVEFNPALVTAWKLLGYKNRLLAPQDFNNDRKDGGEMGAGHTVTVLYEVIPAGADSADTDRSSGRPSIDPLKYQAQPASVRPETTRGAARSGEWLTVKARYKAPEGEQSDLVTQPVRTGTRARHLPLASAVAEFGMLLRAGRGNAAQWDALAQRVGRLDAAAGPGSNLESFRELVEIARGLARLR